MRAPRSSVLLLALALPPFASGRAAAQTTPPAVTPAPPAVAPAPPPPVVEPAPAPAAPETKVEAAPPPAFPAPVEAAPVVETPPASPPPASVVAAPSPPPVATPERPRLGVTLGLISLPRPIEIEATYRMFDALAVSAQYSMLPDLTAPGGSASLRLRAFQGIARWFPFKGSFFLGSGVGYQTFQASLSKTVEGGTLTTTADLSGVFVSPQLGWLFVWQSGFALGLQLGVQIPLPKDPVVPSTYNGQPVPSQPGPGFSQEVVDQSADAKDQVTTLGKLANKYPIPNIQLLRIGFFF